VIAEPAAVEPAVKPVPVIVVKQPVKPVPVPVTKRVLATVVPIGED